MDYEEDIKRIRKELDDLRKRSSMKRSQLNALLKFQAIQKAEKKIAEIEKDALERARKELGDENG